MAATNLPGRGPARLFWAVGLDAGAQAFADAECARLAPIVDRVRWVAPGGRHLTLHFLGDTTLAAGLATAEGLRAPLAALPPFEVTLGPGDWFPSPAHPVVLALGVRINAPLGALVSAVGEAVAEHGFPADGRPWRGHVTLARIGRQGKPRASLVTGTPPPAPAGTLRIDRVTLFESRVAGGGRRYRPVMELPFAMAPVELQLDSSD